MPSVYHGCLPFAATVLALVSTRGATLICFMSCYATTLLSLHCSSVPQSITEISQLWSVEKMTGWEPYIAHYSKNFSLMWWSRFWKETIYMLENCFKCSKKHDYKGHRPRELTLIRYVNLTYKKIKWEGEGKSCFLGAFKLILSQVIQWQNWH